MLRVISGKTPVFHAGKSFPLRGFAAGLVYVESWGVIVAKDQATLGAFKALQRANNAYWAKFKVGGQLSVDGQIGKNTLASVKLIIANLVTLAQRMSGLTLPYSVPGSTRELAFDAEGYARMISDYGGIPFPSTSPDQLSTDYHIAVPAPTTPDEIDDALVTNGNDKPSMLLWVGLGVVAVGAVLLLGGKKKKEGLKGSKGKGLWEKAPWSWQVRPYDGKKYRTKREAAANKPPGGRVVHVLDRW